MQDGHSDKPAALSPPSVIRGIIGSMSGNCHVNGPELQRLIET